MADKIVIGILRALLTADTAQFEDGLRRASAGLQAFSKDTATIGRQATQLGASLTKVLTLPLVALGAGVAKVAIDFEASFAGVRKTTEASVAQLDRMSKGLRELAKQIPINVNELNALAEVAGALGIPAQSVVEFTRVMAILGKTTNVTAEQAANDIAKIQNIFEAVGQNTERFASALLLLGREGASTESQIIELANRMAAAGRAVGFSQEQLLGWAAAIANVGIEAEAGGSAFSRTVTDISLAVAKGTKDLQAFASVAKMSVDDFVTLFRRDGPAATLAFVNGLADVANSGGDLIKTLNQAGFIEVRQLNLLRALALAIGGPQGLNNMLKVSSAGWTENTETTRVAGIRFATVSAELTKLWSRIKDIGITLGMALLPLMKDTIAIMDELLPIVERMATAFAALPVAVQGGVVAFGLMLAALGPIVYTFGQLAIAASGLSFAFTKKGMAIRAVTGLMGLATTAATGLLAAITRLGIASVAFLATPLGASIAAAGLLAAGFLYLRSRTEDVSDEMLETSFGIKKVVEGTNPLIEQLRKTDAATMEVAVAFEQGGQSLEEFMIQQAAAAEQAREMRANIEELGTAMERHNRAMQMFRPQAPPPLDLKRAEEELNQALGRLKGLNVSMGASMTEQLAAARKEVAAFTAIERKNIDAGLALGNSNKEIKDSLAQMNPPLIVSEGALGLYRDQLQSAGTAAKKTARDFAELTGVQERQQALQLAGLLDKGQLQLARMTTSSQEEVAKALIEGVRSWTALGEAVPQSVQRQLNAVFQLRVVPDILQEIRKGTESLKAEQRETLGESFARSQALAEATADVQLKSINMTTAANRQAADINRDIEFARAQHTIDMAEQAGVHWRDLYAMDRALHRAKVNAAIADENRQFHESTKLLDMTDKFQSAQYIAMRDEHNARIQEMEEQFLQSEQAKWDALRRTKDVWFVALKDMKARAMTFVNDTTDNLFSLLTGVGHDVGGELRREADEAKEHFEKVKRSGKSSAEAISNAFQRYREAEDRANYTFLERMHDVWLSFKSMVIDILNDLLGHFTRSFIAGMVRAIAGAKLGEAVGTSLLGGVTRGATAAAVGATVAGVGTTAAFAGAEIAGVESAIFGGGTAAAGGAAAGIGGALAGLATNPFTIGIAAGGLLALGIAKKGWFRGGEEAKSVNPRRDQFQLQFAKGLESVAQAGGRLAALLAQLKPGGGGEGLFRALQAADTVKEFESAQSSIVEFLARNRIRVRSFRWGGFVPPNEIMPAVLHGGMYGEDIVPRQTEAPQRHIVINHNITIEGMIDREGAAAFYRDIILPMEKRALTLNTDDLLTVHRRTVVEP